MFKRKYNILPLEERIVLDGAIAFSAVHPIVTEGAASTATEIAIFHSDSIANLTFSVTGTAINDQTIQNAHIESINASGDYALKADLPALSPISILNYHVNLHQASSNFGFDGIASVQIAPLTINPVADAGIAQNLSFNGVVALLDGPQMLPGQDPNVAFNTLIDWGDGSSLTSATILQGPSLNQYYVVGSHTFSSSGDFFPTLSVDHFGDSYQTNFGDITVSADASNALLNSSRVYSSVDPEVVFGTFTPQNGESAAADSFSLTNVIINGEVKTSDFFFKDLPNGDVAIYTSLITNLSEGVNNVSFNIHFNDNSARDINASSSINIFGYDPYTNILDSNENTVSTFAIGRITSYQDFATGALNSLIFDTPDLSNFTLNILQDGTLQIVAPTDLPLTTGFTFHILNALDPSDPGFYQFPFDYTYNVNDSALHQVGTDITTTFYTFPTIKPSEVVLGEFYSDNPNELSDHFLASLSAQDVSGFTGNLLLRDVPGTNGHHQIEVYTTDVDAFNFGLNTVTLDITQNTIDPNETSFLTLNASITKEELAHVIFAPPTHPLLLKNSLYSGEVIRFVDPNTVGGVYDLSNYSASIDWDGVIDSQFFHQEGIITHVGTSDAGEVFSVSVDAIDLTNLDFTQFNGNYSIVTISENGYLTRSPSVDTFDTDGVPIPGPIKLIDVTSVLTDGTLGFPTTLDITFRTNDLNATKSSMTSFINWSDPNDSSGDHVVPVLTKDLGGPLIGLGYQVSHTYNASETYFIALTIDDTADNLSSVTAVYNLILEPTTTEINFIDLHKSIVEGSFGNNLELLDFSSSAGGDPSQFSAIIHFADGSPDATGTITANPDLGSGFYSISINFNSTNNVGPLNYSVDLLRDGVTFHQSATLTILDAPITIDTLAEKDYLTNQIPNEVILATFSSQNPHETASDFFITSDFQGGTLILRDGPNGTIQVIAQNLQSLKTGSYPINIQITQDSSFEDSFSLVGQLNIYDPVYIQAINTSGVVISNGVEPFTLNLGEVNSPDGLVSDLNLQGSTGGIIPGSLSYVLLPSGNYVVTVQIDPTVNGRYSFNLRVKDVFGNITTQNYSGRVGEEISPEGPSVTPSERVLIERDNNTINLTVTEEFLLEMENSFFGQNDQMRGDIVAPLFGKGILELYKIFGERKLPTFPDFSSELLKDGSSFYLVKQLYEGSHKYGSSFGFEIGLRQAENVPESSIFTPFEAKSRIKDRVYEEGLEKGLPNPHFDLKSLTAAAILLLLPATYSLSTEIKPKEPLSPFDFTYKEGFEPSEENMLLHVEHHNFKEKDIIGLSSEY